MRSMFRARRLWLIVVALTLMLVLALGAALWGAHSALASGAITLTPTSGVAGGVARIAGSGFRKKEALTISFDSTQVARATTSSSGSFSATFTVPTAAAPGAHTVTATAAKSSDSASAAFRIVNTTGSWLGFGGSAAGGFDNPAETTLGASNVAQATQKWSADVSTTGSTYTVVAGTLYTDTGTGVNAVNAATGALLWYTATNSGEVYQAFGPPAYDNGIIYDFGGDSHLYALDAQTGATLWTIASNSAPIAPPSVVNGVLYQVTVNNVTAQNQVYAFNGLTGAQLWSYTFPQSYLTPQTPAVANGTVYVMSDSGSAYALNGATGALLWTTAVGAASKGYEMAAVDGSTVFVLSGSPVSSQQSQIAALDAATGAIKWTAQTPVFGASGPAVGNGMVYVNVANNGVYAYDEGTGALVWSDTAASDIPGGTAPAYANGVVYIAANGSYVTALDAQTGATLATFGSCSTVTINSPIIAQGVVYAGCGASVSAFFL